jgi:hypothetical protein
MPGRSFVENDPFDWGDRAVLVRHARAYHPATSALFDMAAEFVRCAAARAEAST